MTAADSGEILMNGLLIHSQYTVYRVDVSIYILDFLISFQVQEWCRGLRKENRNLDRQIRGICYCKLCIHLAQSRTRAVNFLVFRY